MDEISKAKKINQKQNKTMGHSKLKAAHKWHTFHPQESQIWRLMIKRRVYWRAIKSSPLCQNCQAESLNWPRYVVKKS
jgi:hypothetical protein